MEDDLMRLLYSLKVTLGITMICLSVLTFGSTAMAINFARCRDIECRGCSGKADGAECFRKGNTMCTCTCQGGDCVK
jgi:hypothetical protein